ncbi:MAG: hypothetical protein ACREJN_14885 [Nitrospiraceae bacterium]
MTVAVVTTDHLDYAPGETAVITTSNHAGDGLQFAAGELERFQVTRTDGMGTAPASLKARGLRATLPGKSSMVSVGLPSIRGSM